MGAGAVTPSMESATAEVLVVDDEPDIADLYGAWLGEAHEVDVVYDGESALERVGRSTDVVFLDRQMPSMTGDEVLDTIDERGLDCWVVMVTAIDPDFDIVDMPFDDYLTKPVGREQLSAAIEEMLARNRYEDELQEYFAMASKKASLETAKHRTELDRSEEYLEVSERVEELEAEAAAAATSVDDPESLFRDFPDGS